jgi:hypothetical protein
MEIFLFLDDGSVPVQKDGACLFQGRDLYQGAGFGANFCADEMPIIQIDGRVICTTICVT